MKNLFLAVLFFIINNCSGQKNNINTIEMKTFNIQKFKENKGKQGYVNEYRYSLVDKSEVRELDITSNATKNMKTYQREIIKEFSPFKYVYTYYNNGLLRTSSEFFNNSHIGIYKSFDTNGNLVQQIDDDKNFKHSFEQIRDIVLKEKNVDIYDTRQAVALRHDTPNAEIKKYYQIHVLNSKLVGNEWYSQPDYSLIIDDAAGKIVRTSENEK